MVLPCVPVHGKKKNNLTQEHGNICSADRRSFAPPFLRDAKNNVVVLFVLSRPNAAGPWTVTSIYDELRCRDTTALKHLMSGYVASPAVSSVALKLPSIPALCAALTSKASACPNSAWPSNARGSYRTFVLHKPPHGAPAKKDREAFASDAR